MPENNFKNFIVCNKWLLIILIASFGLSIFYSFYYRIEPQVDARAYDKIAINIADGSGYREAAVGDIKYDNAIARVGPIYEYFLAGIYRFWGHSYPAVWILQALIHAISAYLIYLICLLVFSESENKKKVGLWAAAIFGFYPDLIEISAMLMMETLYLFFTCLLVYLFLLYIKNNNFRIFLLMSLVSGLAVLVRPPIILFLPIIFFYLYRKKEWSRILIMLFMLILVFLPWTIRNYKIYGEIMPFGTAGAMNFWIGNHPGADGEQGAGSVLGEFMSKNTPIDVQKESTKQFKNFVLNYPSEFVELTLMRVNKYFSILRPMGFWFYTSGWRQILFVLCSAAAGFFVLVFGIAGMARSFKLKNEYLNYLLAFTVATPLLMFITVVETRYRFQIYPFLAVFAAYFMESFRENRSIWIRILGASFVIIITNGLIDGLVNLSQFKDKIMSHFG